MKFITEKTKEEEPKIELWLEGNKNGTYLKGKDKDGLEATIMLFKYGGFYRYSGAKLEGLKTNEGGQILEE